MINSFGLPHKGYKNGARRHELRQQILAGLSARSGVVLENLDEFRQQYLESHDCLDSLVAAVAAALWTKDGPILCSRRPGEHGR